MQRPSPRTPVRRNGVATKGRIIEAAIAMIAEDGEALAMRPLARRAGCSPAAIYQFFADLDDLGAAIVDQVTDDAVAELAPRLSPDLARRDPVAFFAALMDGVVALQAARPETLCLVRPQPDGPRAALAGALREMIRGMVSDAFAKGCAETETGRREEVLTIAQHALIGAMAGVPARDAAERGRYLADVADLVGSFVARALRPQPH
ncbi:TetR/AcrR family transcriptional regulator [Erythrobacter sp. NE805]|uniref:TetR/AcrR family transcriptional regulator n=1 Tax=Erythrobacter sp. NE805 TaxID=3389875 RepID=UPI00396B16F6